MRKASIPGQHKKARNPRFIKGTPRIVNPEKLPIAKTVNPMALAAKAVQGELPEQKTIQGIEPSPNRGDSAPQVTIGNIGSLG